MLMRGKRISILVLEIINILLVLDQELNKIINVHSMEWTGLSIFGILFDIIAPDN